MRLPTGAAMALASGLIGAGISAEDRGINPLTEHIRKQETVTAQAPGRGNGEAWLKLAVLCQHAARYRESEQAYRRAIGLLKSGDRGRLADATDRLGTLYAECGEFAKAERLERRALDIRKHENDVAGTGISHTHLSVVFLGKREFSAAEAEAETAMRLLMPEPETMAAPEDKMSALINLALARCARSACGTAVPQLRSALAIAHRNYADDSIPVGYLDFLLGYALWQSGGDHSAGELMRNGTQELSTQLGWGHPMYVRVMRQYGMFLSQSGHESEAEEIRARIARFDRRPGTVDARSLMFR